MKEAFQRRRIYAHGSQTRAPTPPVVTVSIKDDDGNWKTYHFSVYDADELVKKVQRAKETSWRNAWRANAKDLGMAKDVRKAIRP